MRKTIIIGISVLVLLLGTICVVAIEGELSNAAPTTVPPVPETVPQETINDFAGLPLEEALEYLDRREAEKIQQAKKAGTYVESEKVPPLWYEVCYASATEEQKAALDNYRGPYGWSWINYPRQARIIVGEIPEDAPRLTLEQAEQIIQHALNDPENEGHYLNYFNNIYAAFRRITVEDYDGGSGITHIYFGLNDSMTQYLDLSDGRIYYHDKEVGLKITVCTFYGQYDFVSILEMMERGDIPPVREE